METPEVTVLISVYNGEGTIRDAVLSCLSQDMKEIEVLVINDGSTDGTGKILEDLLREDPRIRVVSQPNIGLTRSLNRGLWLARTPLIARLDADDLCESGRLKAQYEFLMEHPDYVIVGGWVRVGRGIRRFPRTDEEIRKVLSTGNPFDHSVVMYRRELVLEVGGYDEHFRYAQDRELWFRLLRMGKGYNLPRIVGIKGIGEGMISEAHGQAQLFFSMLGELKNLPHSPSPLETTGAIVKKTVKLPFYTPRIRRAYRTLKNMLRSSR